MATETEPARLEAALAAACQRGRAAWPGVELEEAEVARHLARHVVPGNDLVAALGNANLEDLYLALACTRGDRKALELFERDLVPVVRATLARMRAADDAIEETMQGLRELLLVAHGDRPAKLADYAGRGRLHAWLRAVATHTYLNHVRSDKPERHADVDVLDGVSTSEASPELAHLKKLYGAELKHAFIAALAVLEPQERTTIRYFYVDGVDLGQLGRLLGVSRATAHRRLQRARTRLARATTEQLRAQLPGADRELDSIRHLVQSQIDITHLSDVLASNKAG